MSRTSSSRVSTRPGELVTFGGFTRSTGLLRIASRSTAAANI
jgi:hypothetical protein